MYHPSPLQPSMFSAINALLPSNDPLPPIFLILIILYLYQHPSDGTTQYYAKQRLFHVAFRMNFYKLKCLDKPQKKIAKQK